MSQGAFAGVFDNSQKMEIFREADGQNDGRMGRFPTRDPSRFTSDLDDNRKKKQVAICKKYGIMKIIK